MKEEWYDRYKSGDLVGYKNRPGNQEPIYITGQNNYRKNLDATLSVKHGNELTVSFIYYLNYSQLKTK